MTNEQTLITYHSKFIDEVNVNVIFKEDNLYPILNQLFEMYGVGFLDPDSGIIILDGERFINNDQLNIDDLRIVEAHEVSHIILQHKGGDRSPKDEMEADLGAYILLKKNGFSVDRLIDIFEDRHGIKFNEQLLELVEDRV